MKALQYRKIGSKPEVVEVETPEPGPGQLRLKVTAAGICHSDAFVMAMPEEGFPYPLPLTLGHEGAGVVDALGEGATGVEIGTSVIVYGPWGCGLCLNCARGRENYCLRAADLGIVPPGLGAPGAMAEYMIIDSPRHVVPIGDLDPVRTVPLTDAGLTPYHAISLSLPKLVPGSTVVVIGAGGLGHVGIRLLRLLCPARVIALDVNEEKLEFAAAVGAHETVLSDGNAVSKVRDLVGGRGAEVVIDFVGSQATIDTANAVIGVGGDLTIVGIGGGGAAVGIGFFAQPFEVTARAPYWGTRDELIELVDLAHTGVLDIEVEQFTLDEAPHAYERMAANSLRGRAVIVP